MQYLKIENPGVAPSEAFTLLGATTKKNAGEATIGCFGSGNKHSAAVMLRNELNPVIFAGTLRMSFGKKPIKFSDGIKSHAFEQVIVSYSGKDENGKTRNSTEDLGFVLDYGATDWASIGMALREYVSNAIDRAIDEGEAKFVRNFMRNMSDHYSPEARNEIKNALENYRKSATDFEDVVVEIVEENQVRAKTGTTRIFVPINDDVHNFYVNLGKWFLHFSEPESLKKQILPKKNRSMSGRQAAVIYRRGVFVREYQMSELPSLFDYNIPTLKMDESRNVDDWNVRAAAAGALMTADDKTIGKLFAATLEHKFYWEHEFDRHVLNPDRCNTPELEAQVKKTWMDAFVNSAGGDCVATTKDMAERVKNKGFHPLVVSEEMSHTLSALGVKSYRDVLNSDDLDGRELFEATPAMKESVRFIWNCLKSVNLTADKPMPKVSGFRTIMKNNSQTMGFYRDNTVFLSSDLDGAFNSQMLAQTALEEIGHYLSGATDCTRDFQDWAFRAATAVMLNQLVKIA